MTFSNIYLNPIEFPVKSFPFFSSIYMYHPNHYPLSRSNNVNVIWYIVHLSAWGFALIWITLSCCWGLAGPINSLLSYNGFFPLSRLTYCTYLIHPTVMLITSFQSEGPMHLRHGLIVRWSLLKELLSWFLLFYFPIFLFL